MKRLVKVKYTYGTYDSPHWSERQFRWIWTAWIWSYWFTFIHPMSQCNILIKDVVND